MDKCYLVKDEESLVHLIKYLNKDIKSACMGFSNWNSEIKEYCVSEKSVRQFYKDALSFNGAFNIYINKGHGGGNTTPYITFCNRRDSGTGWNDISCESCEKHKVQYNLREEKLKRILNETRR